MNLHGTGNGDQVGLEIDQDFAHPIFQRVGFLGEAAVVESEEVTLDVAEEAERAAGFLLANSCVSRLRPIRHHDDSNLTAFANVQRNEAAAADDLVVGMRREHQQPLAA